MKLEANKTLNATSQGKLQFSLPSLVVRINSGMHQEELEALQPLSSAFTMASRERYIVCRIKISRTRNQDMESYVGEHSDYFFFLLVSRTGTVGWTEH